MKVNLNEFESRVKLGLIKKFVNGDYIGWCYTPKCQFEKKWDSYTILARGIVTWSDGTVISLPFTKFFNLGEPEAEPIPWSENITVTEKIDGSLIIVSFHNGQMILNSKGSFTSEHAIFARKWINEHMFNWMNEEIQDSLFGFILPGYSRKTYCFEAVFPEKDNVKVISYGDQADLTLLAVIDSNNGSEMSYDKLEQLCHKLNIRPVKKHDYTNITDFISRCKRRDIHEGEGIVLHFSPSGKRIKVKSEEYIRLHRLIAHISPKHILDSLINGDDIESIYASLPDELFEEVKNIIFELYTQYEAIELRSQVIAENLNGFETKKEQALYILSHTELSDIKSVIFEMIDGKDYKNAIWSIVRKSLKDEVKEEI